MTLGETGPIGSSAAPHASALSEDAQEWERRGQLATARRRYEKTLRELDSSQTPLAIDLVRWIGRTYLVEGYLEAALDCGALLLHTAEASGDPQAIARALNFLGAVHQQRGSVEEAVVLYQRAERYAREAADPGLVAAIQSNRGVAANIQGELLEALEHYRRSLAGLKAERLHDHVISALNNLGKVLTDLQRWDEAEAAYAEALEVCEDTGNSGQQMTVQVNRAALLVRQERYAEAESICGAAFRLARASGDTRALGGMSKLQGIVARELGDPERAEEHLERAAQQAEERSDVLLAAEVAREQAVLFRGLGRNREALVSLDRARRHFEQLRARRDLADVGRRLRELESDLREIARSWGEAAEEPRGITVG